MCKESGCVKMSSSSDPRDTMVLAADLDDHFYIREFDDNNNYAGKFLKVIDDTLVDLGYVTELEASGQIATLDCDKCPPVTG